MKELIYLELLLRRDTEGKFQNVVRVNDSVTSIITSEQHEEIVKRASELSAFISKAMSKK